MNKFFSFIAALAVVVMAACGPAVSEIHNLTPDESRRAQTHADAYFNAERAAGIDASGQLIKKKGSFLSCRPQDSNSNDLVTCTGMVPNMQGGFVQATMYCGYNTGSAAILGCNDKDQK